MILAGEQSDHAWLEKVERWIRTSIHTGYCDCEALDYGGFLPPEVVAF